MHNNYTIIMAGGIGSRFWPLSTPEKPKQFLDILGTGKSMLQMTVERVSQFCPTSQIYIVTSANYEKIIIEQIPELSTSQILKEPCMRNTAPCIAYATWKIHQLNSKANLIIVPSDHYIPDTNNFTNSIKSGLKFIEEQDNILTLGISPTEPATGYGYIQAEKEGNLLADEISKVKAFKEKPDSQTALNYLSKGNYLWNAGIFLGTTHTFKKAFQIHLPVLFKQFEQIANDLNSESEQKLINQLYPNCENISIDYGILEKATNISVQKAKFNWSDLGAWNALHGLIEKDNYNNSKTNKAVLYESENCMVHIPENAEVLIQGVKDLIIVMHENKLLITSKNMEQQVKNNLNKIPR